MMASRNNTAIAAPNNKVKYSRLADSDEGYIDLQVRNTDAEKYLNCVLYVLFVA